MQKFFKKILESILTCSTDNVLLGTMANEMCLRRKKTISLIKGHMIPYKAPNKVILKFFFTCSLNRRNVVFELVREW